ncbi:hypothetical protein GQ457_04G005360 [Hibiscus cannabinus]
MSSGAGSKAWFIAASGVGGVEGLKDKGFCRWNIHAIRSINQRACCNLRSYSQPENLSSSSSSSSSVVPSKVRDEKAKEGEESLRKVIFFHFNMSSSSSSTERPRNLQMELYCKPRNLSSQSSEAIFKGLRSKQSEESLRTVIIINFTNPKCRTDTYSPRPASLAKKLSSTIVPISNTMALKKKKTRSKSKLLKNPLFNEEDYKTVSH